MITVSLVGAGTPALVQIVLSATPDGAEWTLTGASDGFAWTVPGGMGTGDGAQLALVDNRAPLNVPVSYTLSWGGGSEVSAPITVPGGSGDMVLQSLDGQKTVSVALMDGTQALTMDTALSLFGVPGRRTPVSRYSVTSLPRGTFIARADVSQTADLDALLAPGEPILVRLTAPAFELPLVQVVHITGLSAAGFLVGLFRHWELPYVPVDDPFMDQRLGAFTWDFIDALQVSGSTVVRNGDDMETLLAGLTWAQIDALDWSVYA